MPHSVSDHTEKGQIIWKSTRKTSSTTSCNTYETCCILCVLIVELWVYYLYLFFSWDIKSVWFFTSYRYNCFFPWKRGMFLSDFSWASRRCRWGWNVAKPRKLFLVTLSQEWFELVSSPTFTLTVPHIFHIFLHTGQKMAVTKRSLNFIILSEAYKLEFLGTI